MDGIKERQNGIGKKINNRETCPGCGNRARYPEHPLCPLCNAQYLEETATALERELPILKRLSWTEEKGKITLQRLEEKLEVKEEEEGSKKQLIWNQAHQKIQAELQRQEILQIDKLAYNKAVGKRFERLWNAKKRNQQLSRQVYAFWKAVESLKEFLADLGTKVKQSPTIAEAEIAFVEN